ncbi:MAG: hypothetical protein RL531_969, partial [Actinomycetota bacterium]
MMRWATVGLHTARRAAPEVLEVAGAVAIGLGMYHPG